MEATCSRSFLLGGAEKLEGPVESEIFFSLAFGWEPLAHICLLQGTARGGLMVQRRKDGATGTDA